MKLTAYAHYPTRTAEAESMADIVTLHAGDDFKFAVTLKEDGSTFTIDSGATVSVNVVRDSNGLAMLDSAVVMAEDGTLDDWAASKILISMASAVTATLSAGYGALEIQVDDDVESYGKRTWLLPVKIVEDRV